ncbi:MAG: EndoU domain-containing protein, partial [Synergistaceae bacterium]|nr:EndoU domain-containing protein [Synergistaceae bacterium]
SINAIYYDIKTGDLIDFHGGLHDLRDGVIDSIVSADLEFAYKPQNAFRALRFKARYNFKLSPRVDEALRMNIGDYTAKMQGTALSNEIAKMTFNGYSLKCWRALSEYDAVSHVFVDKINEDYMNAALTALDAAYAKNKDDRGYRRYFMAAALWPIIEAKAEAEAMGFKASMAKVLDDEGKVYVYWRNERRELEEFLTVEYYLTHPSELQPALKLTASPYFKAAFDLLKVRAKVNPAFNGVLAFWEGIMPYDKAVLSELQRIANFQRAAVNHIFMGEIKDGAASGYHYSRIKNARGYILPAADKEYISGYGAYKAKIAGDGMIKDANSGYSSFFPDAMTPQEVIDAINEAYNNKSRVDEDDNAFAGFAANGMEIIIFVDNRGKIISAFPNLK